MANAKRLMELSMVGPLAVEVAAQIEDSAGGGVAWADVTGKPATFPATTPVASATTAATLTTPRAITVNFAAAAAAPTFNGSAPITCSIARGAAQANSAATEVAALVTDFNALLAKLRTVGVIAT